MNPFRIKADRANASVARLGGESVHDRAMRENFPLGPGYGNASSRSRIDASVTRAAELVKAIKDAKHWTAMADAFDRGEITEQGLVIDAAFLARRAKREAAAARKAAREALQQAQEEVTP